MSGRSAYVRKKITETKTSEKKPVSAGRGGFKSPDLGIARVSDYIDESMINYPPGPGTGYGTSNGRFLKFSESHQPEMSHAGPPTAISTYSSGSQSGGSEAGRRDGAAFHQGPMDNFAYARVRRPTIKTEDVSGIERSGFRSAIDKKSDDIRKGLGKAFGFGKKSKKDTDSEPRTQSAAGMAYMRAYDGHEDDDVPPVPNMVHPPLSAWESNNALPPPNRKLPPIPAAALSPTIKRWVGAGRPVQKWNKLSKDPELWDPNGDVLVYLARRDQSPRPNASFRLSSHIIEATESRFLVQLMREGSTEDDINLPPSPSGVTPGFSRNTLSPHYGFSHYGGGHPTPPTSESASVAEVDGQISYEMYFPTPPELTKSEAHRHVITTRNIFALLYHASLVGISLYQALTDLHTRLEKYMPPDADNIGTILNYLSARSIDDCRNDPETAVSLLGWAESQPIRWEEGWREAFLHAVGMYARLEKCTDFKHVTPITRALLERACLETQLRVQAAEERLTGFSYGDIWPPGGPIANSPAKAAADRLQKFFVSHFTTDFGEWPPPPSDERSPDGEETWLTRTVARKLQKDFGALYDYLVNRDITWDESETRSSRKWMMVSESGNKAFDSDTADLPMTDLLIEWDIRSKLPHIPHPYPLVPDSIPSVNASTSSRDRAKKSDKDKNKGGEDRVLERRVQLAYTEATNIYILGSDFTQSDLIDSFVKFEKSDHVGSVDPMAARRGRWVLIYGILQTLATVSVDAPNIRYKDDVVYHLSPRLKGTKVPPWKGIANPTAEASHEFSHCWMVPRTWNAAQDSEAFDEVSPITKMMRAQGHNFPPPPSARSFTSGWHTPARSARSSAWGGSSAMSTVSDDAHSVRTAATSVYRVRSRDGTKSKKSHGTPTSATGGNDWPVRSQSIQQPRSGDVATMASRPLPPLTINSSVTGDGGFLDLDESPPHAQGKRAESRSRPRRERESVMTPIIRDFDELDVIDDHAP
ncbi:hypothetical protein AB5N19_13964 [Seiridium cardinale]|uniref:DUF8004 domain-containing protein n=1 Tax=Seiridium cardinale TaxID=138064 RepID=A0ABR2X9A9_9PEZI